MHDKSETYLIDLAKRIRSGRSLAIVPNIARSQVLRQLAGAAVSTAKENLNGHR
jgi:hypothetical protein